jgi:hypothetical protein
MAEQKIPDSIIVRSVFLLMLEQLRFPTPQMATYSVTTYELPRKTAAAYNLSAGRGDCEFLGHLLAELRCCK